MCDILVHDSKSSACLNDEQKSLLATFDHRGANVTLQRSSKRYDNVLQRLRPLSTQRPVCPLFQVVRDRRVVLPVRLPL